MSDSNPQLCTINFFNLPPVHPKCRWFDHAKILALGEKLAASGDLAAVDLLGKAMNRLLSQPRQGAWHQFAPGVVGNTHIISTDRLRRLSQDQMSRIIHCFSGHTRAMRRRN